MKYKLSKSTFIRGLQCEKSLYLYKKHYKLKDSISPSSQAVFDQGNQLGLLAQELFPGGIDSSPSSHFKIMDSVIKTKEFFDKGESIIVFPSLSLIMNLELSSEITTLLSLNP